MVEERRDATPPIPAITTPLLAGLKSAFGLESTTAPTWCVQGQGFAERLWLVGDRIIVSKPMGRSQIQHTAAHIDIVDQIVAQFIPDDLQFVLCLDWKHLHGTTKEARHLWVSAMSKNERIAGIVFCQTTPFFRMSIKLGRRFNLVKFPVEIADDYHEAIAKTAIALGRTIDAAVAAQAIGKEPSESGGFDIVGPVDEVVRFLSMIDWNLPGTSAFDLIPENHKIKTLYDAFAIIKMEVDTILEERKLREDELYRARHAAEQADRAKSAFLANMSHEIRTPMNGILGMARFLADSPLGEEQADWVRIIRQSAEGLLKIMNDILDITQVEAGRLVLENVEIDVHRVVDRVIGLMSAQASEKGLSLEAAVDPAIPRDLIGDPGRLAQILLNLVGNSVKFTERGGVRVELAIERETAEHVMLRGSVTDTGPGIQEEARQNIFDAFAQADVSLSRRHGGVGLGLTIARQLVHLMQGQIYLAESSREGCTFCFTALLERVSPASRVKLPSTPSPSPTSAQATQGRKPARLLLVEDNKVNQLVAMKMLEKLGYSATLAVDGVDALAALARAKYDLVLMDLQMPRMSGFEAAREIRSGGAGVLDPGVPIVAMTASAMKGDREQCIAAGMDDHIAKPVSLERLAAAIEGQLSTRPR
jgi:signal transduction histidine kinase/ActR/RegA family two-component response regulator